MFIKKLYDLNMMNRVVGVPYKRLMIKESQCLKTGNKTQEKGC